MNALGGTILAILLFSVVVLPQRWALVAMVVGALFLTQGLTLDVAGFSFAPTRILSYACFVRVLNRREFSFSHLNKVDWGLIVLYVFTTLVLLTRPEEAVPLRIAKMMDVLFGYFAFRGLITRPEDLIWLLRALAVLLVPYVLLLAVESTTQSNPFGMVGGSTVPWIREGKLRCFGSFRHPSLLGSLGATFFPLFIAMAWDKKLRRYAVAGAILSAGVVVFSNSGGPLSALATGVMGWCLWPIRTRMRLFRWGLIGMIAVMAVFMNAPIWYLITRISSITGGTGWHRSYLIDVSMRHIDEWWLIGMQLKDTSGWFSNVIRSTGGADITNQYISFGLNAGIVGIALFIFLIYRTFSYLGLALAAVRSKFGDERTAEPLLWGLGVTLAVHVSNWLGISYWDQFYVIWLLQMAATCSLSQFWLREPEASCEGATDSQREHESAVPMPVSFG